MGAYPYSSIPTPVPPSLGFKDGGNLFGGFDPLTGTVGGGGGDPTANLPDASNPYGAPTDIFDPTGRYQIIAPTKYHGWLKFDRSTGGTSPMSPGEIAAVTGGGGAGGTGGGTANYHLDPRELQLQYDTLYNQMLQHGMTEEDARRQALAGLLEARNRDQVQLASTYGDIAKNAAAFAQKPEDAVADLMYRQAMYGKGQGGTPYGSIQNPQFGQYQTALSDKFQQMFGPAAGALTQAQGFLMAPPPSDYLSPDQRSQLGQNPGQTLPTPTFSNGAPTPANPFASGAGATGAAAASPAPAVPTGAAGPTGSIATRPVTTTSGGGPGLGGGAQGGQITGSFFGAPLASGWGFAQGGSASVQPYGMSPASGAPNTGAGLTGMADGALVNFQPVGMSRGGVIGNGSGSAGADIGFSNFGTVSSTGGYAHGGDVRSYPPPMPAEGGLSLNLSEPAKIVGIKSGHVYATVAEPRPDGTPRPERLEIKPLKSELAKDRQLEAQNKQTAMTPQQTMSTQAGNGTPTGQMNPQNNTQDMTGLHAYAQGGDIISFGQTPADLVQQVRSTLSSQYGIQQPQTGLSNPRFLSGDAYTRMSRDPYLQKEIYSPYNAMGIHGGATEDTAGVVGQFSPEPLERSFFRPSVSFT